MKHANRGTPGHVRLASGRRVTMMDVAAMAGVSQATVSLVLNGSPGVRFSAATRQRVLEAADRLGYAVSRRLPSAVTTDRNVIVFLVDEVTTDPWMALAFEGARQKAFEEGVVVTLTVLPDDQAWHDTVLGCSLREPPLGFIFGTILTRQVDPPAVLFTAPSVLLNCYDPKRRLPSVLPGDLEGGRSATERLIRAGRRRIGFINGQKGLDASRDRLRGYQQALSSNDLTFDPALVYAGNWEPDSGYDGARALLSLGDPPDAIFCANDLMAMGCYDALKEAGRQIPTDVAVIGFDNREIAPFLRPALTTLVLPQYDMGTASVEYLLSWVGGLKPRHDHLKLECRLIERGSVEA